MIWFRRVLTDHLLQRIFYTSHKCDDLSYALFKASSYLSVINCTRPRHRRRMAGYLLPRSDTRKGMGTQDLSFYHPNLLCCPDQMLAVTELSQLLVSSSKTVRPIIDRDARCMGHVKIICSEVCSLAPHSHFAE